MTNWGDIGAVEDRLGHRFDDRQLLYRALTHSSALTKTQTSVDSYQRLEFLGDRVLALAVVDMLLTSYPDADEGALAQRLNQLVRKETCASVAADLGLGDAVKLAESEDRSGGRKKKAILGDICEAVIAAIYLDGGLPVARQFIDDHWRPRMLEAEAPPRDAKTTLQEWAQAKGLPLPAYEVTGRTGPDHEPEFTVTVEILGMASGSGSGGSRRSAEQAAAQLVLQREGEWSDEDKQ